MLSLLENGVVRVVLLGTMTLGLVSGVLGVFTLLRKQALIGDALSHATLPGVVLMFIFTSSKDIGVLVVGAAFSAAVALLLMRLIKKYSVLENDAILALILSSFFGLGRFLISLIARDPQFSKAKLDDFIFGSAATMIERDVWTLLIVVIIVFVLMMVFWRHLKLQTFDSEFYQSLGYSNTFMEFLVAFMMILVIVSGIRFVGVILMSSLLIVPGIAARQLSNHLNTNVVLAGMIGALSAFLGTLYSVSVPGGMPTGPVIVVVGTSIAILIILFAYQRGVIAHEIRRQHHQREVRRYRVLIHLSMNEELTEVCPSYLLDEQLVEKVSHHRYVLTHSGKQKVASILGGES